jgi:hypothetical protein
MIVQGNAVGAARFRAHGEEDVRRRHAALAVERLDRQRVRVLEDGAATDQSYIVARERVLNDGDFALDDARDLSHQRLHRWTLALAMPVVAHFEPRP